MSNVSLSQKGGTAELASAILVYKQKADRFGSGGGISLLTEHAIQIINGQPVIKEGKILSQKTMRDMALGILNKKQGALKFIPEYILAQQDKTSVWWMPAQRKTVHFRANEAGLENRCGEVDIPSCIFAVTKHDSYVLCFAGKDRPTPQTPLYFSPFFNVWDEHNICMGSTREVPNGDVGAWIKAYFDSAFSHTNYRSTGAALLREGDREQLWRDLLDKKVDAFPFECLPPAKLTLEQFIAKISI